MNDMKQHLARWIDENGVEKYPGPAGARCAGATGSLPGLSAEYLLGKWDGAAQHFRAGGDTSQAVANAFEICAADLRRQLGLPTERQPEENTTLSHDRRRAAP